MVPPIQSRSLSQKAIEMKKIMAVLAISSVAVFASGCSTSTPKPTPTVTVTVTAPAPAPVVNTVNVAPSECGDVMDLSKEMAEAVAVEHASFGEAATKASNDVDVTAFLTSMSAAVSVMGNKITVITPKMQVAASACRAAVK